MMWKELHTGGPRGLARFVGFLLTVIGGGFLVYYGVWLAMMAILELWDFGYLTWGEPMRGMYRIQFRLIEQEVIRHMALGHYQRVALGDGKCIADCKT